MKKVLIIGSSFIGLVFLAALIIPYVFEKDIKLKLEREIEKNINALVVFDRVSLSVFSHFPNLTLSLHDMSISGKEKFTEDTLISAKVLAMELNLWKLIQGEETEFKRLYLTDPVFNMRVLKNGKSNFDIFSSDTSSSDTTSFLNIALDKITVKNGTIIYDDESLETYIEAHGVNYKGQGDFVKDTFDLKSEATISALTYDYGNIRYLHEKFIALNMLMEMNMRDNEFTFKESEFQINHFKFGLDGAFALFDLGYDMNLKFETQETAFKNILSLIPGVYMEDMNQIQTEGNLGIDGYVRGVYSDSLDKIPAFHINMKIADGMFKIDTLPEAVTNIRMDLEMDNKYGVMDSTVIDLKDFHLEMGKHPFHGRARLEGLRASRIDADIFANLELSELEKIYPMKGLDLKGKVDFELKVKGKLDQVNDKITKVPSFHLNLKLADGRLKYDSLPAAIDNIQFHLLADNTGGDIEKTILQLKAIHLNMGKNPVRGYATIKGFNNYNIDADVDAKLDLADVERMFPIDGIAMKGLFDLEVNAHGTYDTSQHKFPLIDVKMNLTDGWLKSADYPEPVENIHLLAEAFNSTGNFKDTRLNVEQFTYILEKEPFFVQGSLSDMEDYEYDIKIKGITDLAKITKIYPVEGISLSGIIDSDIETKGSISDLEAGRYRKIKSSGQIIIKDLEVQDRSWPHSIHVKDASIEFSPEKITLQNLIGEVGKSNVQLKGDLTNYMSLLPARHNKKSHQGSRNRANKIISGDLMLICDTLDLNQFMTTPSVGASSASGVNPETGSSSYQVWEVPENVDFTFDSEIGYIKYDDLHIRKLDGEIRIKDGVLSLTETGFNTLDADFIVTGDYNTKYVLHPLFDFSVEIKELDINRAYREVRLIRDLAPAAADAYGMFSVTYKLKGELDQNMNVKTPTLNGGGEIRIANAKINGMKIFEEISKTAKKEDMNDPHLKDFVMDTDIKDNKIFVKPFSLKIAGFNTDVEGVSDMEGAIQYIFKIQMLPIDKLKIPFHVSGTYENPKVAIGKGHKLPEE